MSSRNPSLSRLLTGFDDLSGPARVSLILGFLVELSAKISVWVDLSRRSPDRVRGPRWLWALAQLVNGIGPAAYWAVGRR